MTTATQTRVHIRWQICRDLPEVLAIENVSYDYPWTEDEFLMVLRQRNAIAMVAETNDYVVGFMIYELQKGNLNLLNIAVHPTNRRECIGMQLVRKLVGKLSSHRRTSITTIVRESNLSAQLFFRDMGFDATGVHRGHYDDTGEDGYAMEYRL